MHKTKLAPRLGVVKIKPVERVIGKALSAQTATQPLESSADLVGDLFWGLTKYEPELREQVAPERAVNKLLMDWAMQQDSWPAAKANTVGNYPSAIMATSTMWEVLASEDAVKQILDKQQQAEQERQQAMQLAQAAAKAEKDGNQDAADKAMQMANQINDHADQLAAEALQAAEKLSNNALAQGMMASAVKDAAEEAKECNQAMNAWGHDLGSMSFGDTEQVLKLLADHSGPFRMIGQLLGRLRGMAKDATVGAKIGYTGTVTEIALTDELDKVMPDELALLSPSLPMAVRITKLVELAETGLLGWQPKVSAKKTGNFVALIDKSGSMDDQLKFANALALAIALQAREDEGASRKFTLAQFDYGVRGAASDKDGPEHLLRFASTKCSGGTNFDKAFDFATRCLAQHGDADVSDVLFITDGECNISDGQMAAWSEFTAAHSVRLFAVILGNGSTGSLESIADVVIQLPHLDQLTSEQITTRIAKAMAVHGLEV